MISPLFLLSGAGMILVAAGSAWWWQRGKAGLWPAIGWGALAWVVSVALKFAAAVPTTSILHDHSGHPLVWLYTGLLTGIFECAIPLLLIRWTRLRQADWDRAVAFGIGFGGVEALLLGLGSLVTMALLVFAPEALPEAMRKDTLQLLDGKYLTIPLPVVERAATMLIHVFACVLLIYAVRAGQQRWFWASLAYKTLVDGIAGWAILAWKVTSSTGKLVAFELVFVVIAVAALPGLRRLQAAFTALDRPPQPEFPDPL